MEPRLAQAVDAAKLYYLDGLPQDQVARQLGVSRPTVSKLIQLARNGGFVNIAINDPRESSSDLGERLASRFALDDVRIATGPGGPLGGYEELGRVGAELLTEIIGDGELIGLSWGETLWAVARHLTPTSRHGIDFVELKGGVPLQPKRTREYETMSMFCDAFNAYPRTLHLPVFFEHAETKRAVEAERQFQAVLNVGRIAQTAVFTVGGVAPDATLFALGYLSDVERDYLLQNAAGDMCSRFYDEAGQVCLPELDARTVSLSLADLHDKERRVCIAGGRTKVRALAVALSAGYVSHLVTDLAAAQGVLDYAERNNLPRPPGRSTTG